MRIGLDVGGTHTDAVLMDGNAVVARTKTTTSEDVASGIETALSAVLKDQDPKAVSLLTIGSLAAAALDEVAIGATGKLILFAGMVILTSAISTAAMKRLFGGERGRVRGGMDARQAARP